MSDSLATDLIACVSKATWARYGAMTPILSVATPFWNKIRKKIIYSGNKIIGFMNYLYIIKMNKLLTSKKVFKSFITRESSKWLEHEESPFFSVLVLFPWVCFSKAFQVSMKSADFSISVDSEAASQGSSGTYKIKGLLNSCVLRDGK